MKLSEFIDNIKKSRDTRDVVHHEELPAKDAAYGETSAPLHPALLAALKEIGIDKLYAHQCQGVDMALAGKNLVVMTPTSSGKSLIYNLPVLQSALDDPESRAIYLFPLKGLEQDQLKSITDLAARLPIDRPVAATPVKRRKSFTPGFAEIYDGDTPPHRRTKIRETPPNVLLTNPDMLHMGINAFHQKWEHFFRNLKYVIIDEVHTYRGVFGSHMANVLRRLRRIANIYGSRPVFIACSATIANPLELTTMLTGLTFELILKDGAPRGRRDFLFINPANEAGAISPYTVATRLFTSAVRSGFKCIAFTKARRITELMHSWVNKGAGDIRAQISSYRGGFLPEERRVIEKKLFSGELSGVITTSALELGVDIGGLDVCILVGYPGTISATWQRSGRAGRAGRDSLIIMVALNDALDQYFMRHPADFFRRVSESAVLDPTNGPILKSHLLCAVAEAAITRAEAVYDAERIYPVLKELEAEGKVRNYARGGVWYPRKRFPQKDVSIRSTGASYAILSEDGAIIGEAGSTRVFSEFHPDAIYLHRARQWRVITIDVYARRIYCRPADDADYYTRAITDEETAIVSVDDHRELPGTTVNFGTLRVTKRVLGYRKKPLRGGVSRRDEPTGEFPLKNLPPAVFTTTGIWMKADGGLMQRLREEKYSTAGSLHAAEHAAIATLPLYALCDRMDLGGISYEWNEELQSPAVFIYDGHEGGIGLARKGFECASLWFSSAVNIMEECRCEVSCPSCTQDPNCGNNNDPLDKRGAVMILKQWINGA